MASQSDPWQANSKASHHNASENPPYPPTDIFFLRIDLPPQTTHLVPWTVVTKDQTTPFLTSLMSIPFSSTNGSPSTMREESLSHTNLYSERLGKGLQETQ